MTAPTTRADYTDDDYRAIARAACRYGSSGYWWIIDHEKGGAVVDAWEGASSRADVMNGRAAVAEYERRRK